MFGAPYTGYLSLLFLPAVLIIIFIDSPHTLLVTVVAVALMTVGMVRLPGPHQGHRGPA